MAETNAEVRYLRNVNTLGPGVAFMIEQHRPLLCRLGLHSWRNAGIRWPHASGPACNDEKCARCGLKRTWEIE